MAVELLFWEGCPSHPEALRELREALRSLGRDEEVLVREVVDEAQAAEEDFPGSPTIRLDGRDLFPIADPPGLSCRVYRLADGRFSPTPGVDALREALA